MHLLHVAPSLNTDPQPTDDGSELQTLEATCPFNVLPSGVQESFEGQKMEGGSLVCCEWNGIKMILFLKQFDCS